MSLTDVAAATVPLKRVALGGFLEDGDWVESKDQDPEGTIRLVQLADIRDGVLQLRSNRWINERVAERLRVTRLAPRDLLIARMPSPLGRCCMVPDNLGSAVTVVDVAVLRIIDPSFDPAFVMYAINSAVARTQIESIAAGSTRLRVTRKRLSSVHLPMPDLEAQQAIAKYLQNADLRVGNAIQSKRRLVQLLDERRGAIAHGTVTAGIRDGAPRRTSAHPWLGDIPDAWVERPAKWFYREVNERSVQGEEQLMSVSHLTGVSPRSAKNVTMFMASSYAGHKLCRPGDLVVNTMWAWMGALGVSKASGIVSPAYGVYRPVPESPLQPEFADLLLRSRPYIDEYTCLSTGIRSSRLRLYPDRFLTVPIVCPPEDEQRDIVVRVTDATRDLNEAISAALREIELLLEYRTRLIADVVIGRRDVRAEASELPHVDPDELAAVLDAGEGDDDVVDDEE